MSSAKLYIAHQQRTCLLPTNQHKHRKSPPPPPPKKTPFKKKGVPPPQKKNYFFFFYFFFFVCVLWGGGGGGGGIFMLKPVRRTHKEGISVHMEGVLLIQSGNRSVLKEQSLTSPTLLSESFQYGHQLERKREFLL